MRKPIIAVIVATMFGLMSTAAHSATIFADTIIDFFDSGAGPITGPYGGNGGSYPISVSLTNATDGNLNTFVSLPTGSYLTLGFSSGFVFDGVGNDLFVAEIGVAAERANVWISSDFGSTFTFLGVADGGTVTEFDFATIGYTDNVNAVKIVGLDSLGGSPGFDVSYVQGLEGSAVETPLPASAPLLLVGIALLGVARLRKK